MAAMLPVFMEEYKFSVHGIIIIEYFPKRGHEAVYAFLPEDKRNFDYDLLTRLEKEGRVIFMCSRVAETHF